MSFVNPNPGRQRIVVNPNGSRQIPNSLTGYTNASGLAGALNNIMRPSVNFNTQINLSMNRNNDNSSSSNDFGGNGSGSGGGRGGRPHRNANRNGSSKGYFAPSQVETSNISFTTGINSGTIINPYERSSVIENSSLFLLGGSFLSDHSKSSAFHDILEKDIYFKILTSIQGVVNHRVARDFTAKRFSNYIDRLSSALQLYYCIDSILAFDVDLNNTNPGMRRLRSLLDADILSQHERLRRLLFDVAIPPNLLGFIAYMYQNFKFSDTSYSPIYKLEFRTIFHSSSTQVLCSEYYDTIINELREDSEVVSLLLKTFPSMRVDKLVPSSSQPINDPNFRSFWYNSCVTYITKDTNTLKYTREVESDSTDLYYGHFCDHDVDGMFYALCSVYLSEGKTMGPGMWNPYSDETNFRTKVIQTQRSNLLCYSSVYNNFLAPSTTRTGAQSGVFHPVIYSENSNSGWYSEAFVSPEAQKVQIHNLINTRQAVSAAILHLFTGI